MCTFSRGLCVKGPPVINYMKEKKTNSNKVKTYFSESFFKGQSHFLQLKEHLHKKVKGKNGLCKKLAAVLLKKGCESKLKACKNCCETIRHIK